MQPDRSTIPSAEFVFSGHGVQAVDPTEGLYFPTAHALHDVPEGPVHPALQRQDVMPILCTGEFEFDGQFSHTVVVKLDLYLPSIHSVQSETDPPKPKSHTQFVRNVLATGDVELLGQFSQADGPILGLYFPEVHALHAPPLFPDHPALHLQSLFKVLVAIDVE